MANLRKLAKGQECQVMIPDVCNGNPETTVLAHVYVKGMKGMGKKGPDLIGAWACYHCHMAIDGHLKTPYNKETLQLFAYEGVIKTQVRLMEMGVVGW